jgi:DNA replication protein DnaC
MVAEELLEIVMRRYERARTLTSKLPDENWGELLGDLVAVTVMLDRLLHHQVLKCGPRSWRTKTDLPEQPAAA